MEPLPNLGQEVEEGEEVDLCPMEAPVEAAGGGDVAEEVEFLSQGQGLVVLAAEPQGGQNSQGQNGAGGYLGLRVILVSHGLEGIVYNAEGRYSLLQHGGHYFFRVPESLARDRWQLGLE